jgi:dihydroorotase-like cyclic amidohydrolase
MLDMLIQGGRVVTPAGVGDWDVGIVGEKIVEGWQVAGWPTTVILRGKIMVANGQLLGSPSDGQLIPRKIDPRVLRRPAF